MNDKCNNCIHAPVCGKCKATGGHVGKCEHHAQERKGRWIDGLCSRCGYPIPTDSRYDCVEEDDCVFCYHCGAKMDGGVENG